MPSTTNDLRLDHQLCFALYAASRAVVRAYASVLEPEGITYPQYVTLLVLWESPETAVSVGELGSRLHLDSGTLTPLLKRLENMGLVHRQRDVADERRVLVTLTDQGLSLRDRMAGVPRRLAGCYGMKVGDLRRLQIQLVQLTDVLEAGGATVGSEHGPRP